MLAELYGCDVADLLDYQDRKALPAADLQLLECRPAPPTPPTPTPPPRAVEPPQGAALVEVAAEESAAWAMWAESTNVGDLACEQLLADTRALAAGYLAADPPLRVFAATRTLRDRVFALLEGHQHPRQTRDLYVLAGYLCGLLAWISSDLGEPHQADTHGRTAWLCAELAGHDGLRAWTLSTRSKVALWDGRAREATTHARRGAAHRAPGTVGLLLACQEADAWARLGAAGEAQEALARVDEARAAPQDQDDDIGGLFSCDAFRSLNYTTGVRLRTGCATTALEEAAAALAIPTRRAYGTEAQMRITLASAHVALGHPEGAMEALQPVLDLAPEQRLAPMAARLREFACDVARSRMADARTASHLQAAVEHWCLESVPRHVVLPPGAPGTLD
ncbi:XRE family transcriptional regulator [Streptomyces sp. NPDC059122]|uniref:XRE family transcriptional regulator n=1 Tax=Streptomyces sp. NPDC059122 TaxID=3346732 RepID=UPI00367518BB